MEGGTYFFVEHDVTDKKGWDGWFSSWFDIYGAEDMTVDKAKAYPEWEGNEPLLSIPTADGKMTVCLWKMPSGTSKDEFQAFIDRFSCGFSNNKVFQVEHALGANNLNARGFFRDFINVSQGRPSPGYLDAPMLWMAHHHILDHKGFADLSSGISDKINNTCSTPSDCQSIHPAGHKCCLTLFFVGGNIVCLESTPEGFTQEDVRKGMDKFTQGLSRNYVYQLDPANGCNAFHLSEDAWSQDAMTWASTAVKTVDTAATMTTPVGVGIGQ